MSPLYATAFISNVTRTFQENDLKAMVAKSKDANRGWEITSVLLRGHGNFIQYIEGPQSRVETLYQKISNDPRHYGVFQLYQGVLQRREFEMWPMGYAHSGSDDVDGLQLIDWLSKTEASSVGKTLLKTFWSNNF